MINSLTSRQRLINTFLGKPVDHVPVAPLLDVFAAKMLDVPYHELTWQQQIQVARETGMDLFMNLAVGLPDQISNSWKSERIGEEGGGVILKEILHTPVGDVTQVFKRHRYGLPWQIEYPLKNQDDFPVFEYVLDWICEVAEASAIISEAARGIGEDGVTLAWISTPQELMGWMERSEAVMFAHSEPESMRRISDKIHKSQMKMAQAAFEKGLDVLSVGSAGTELFSPRLLREYLSPYAKELFALARDFGKFSYLHMCGKVGQLLDIVQEVHPTVFETLSKPPEGDVLDLGEARDQIGRDIVAKGNMNLTFLSTATPEQVYLKGKEIIEEAGSERFILSVADVLMDFHPVENVKALVRAGQDSFV